MAEIKEKYPTKTIWLYTGSDWEDIWQMPLMNYVDVCVDGEFKIDLKEGIFHNPDVFNVDENDVDEFDKQFEFKEKLVLEGQL